MRLFALALITLFSLLLLACAKPTNPDDPFEPINRQIHQFNRAFDATMLKPPAKLYKAVLPQPVRDSINNFYNNFNSVTVVMNDLLQAEWHEAIKDTWRCAINSTLGVGGLLDVAANDRFKLPPHTNDIGITFAKWGIKKSPYIVIPLLGPSTVRDGLGMLADFFIFTPYPYLGNDAVIYSLLGVRYVDLRAQFLETDKLMGEALDSYSFMRDAYFQYRNNKIYGEPMVPVDGHSVAEEQALGGDYVEE